MGKAYDTAPPKSAEENAQNSASTIETTINSDTKKSENITTSGTSDKASEVIYSDISKNSNTNTSDISKNSGTNLSQEDDYTAPTFSSSIKKPGISFNSLSPMSLFELQKEFLKLSNTFIADFLARLEDMKREYNSQSRVSDAISDIKTEGAISSEQYFYYSSLFGRVNRIYLERAASLVFESKQCFDSLYFTVYFAYKRLLKKADGEEQDGALSLQKAESIIEKIVKNPSFIALDDKSKHFAKERFEKHLLFGLRMKNPTAFVSGLRTILSLHTLTGDATYLEAYEKIRNPFWIEKTKFVDFLEKNQTFLIYIHTLLDRHKKSREERDTKKCVLIEEAKEIQRNTKMARKIFDAFETRLSQDSMELTSEFGTQDTAFQFYAKMNLLSEEGDDFFKNTLEFMQIGTLFQRNQDIFYQTNDLLDEIARGKSLALGDLKKYIQFSGEENSLNAVILAISKNNLYYFLYPIFLYSIAKRVQLSENDFMILRDTSLLESSNMEEFRIVADFFQDFAHLVNNENNFGVDAKRPSKIVFHIRKWGIFFASIGLMLIAFAWFFRFPLYFAGIGLIYTLLYVMSEFFLSYKLRFAKTITGYMLIACFFLLGGFDLNYQQTTTERIAQAEKMVRGTSGTINVETGIAKIGEIFAPTELKTNVLESKKSSTPEEKTETGSIQEIKSGSGNKKK